MSDEDVCVCGHRRFFHGVGVCRALDCECEVFREDLWDSPLEDLIVDSPKARASDPHTSKEAGAAQTSRKNGPIHAAVLLFLWEHPDSRDDDLHEAIGGPDSTPRKRRGELRDAGLVEATGEGISNYGKHTLRWSLTEAGKDYVGSHVRELVELRDRRKRST